MQTSLLLAVIAVLALVGYGLGRNRALAVAGGKIAGLHSVPSYYGFYVALWAGLPALLLLVVWSCLQGPAVMALVLARLPDTLVPSDGQMLGLLRTDILNIARGVAAGRAPDPAILEAAEFYNQLQTLFGASLLVAVSALALVGLVRAKQQIRPDLRARNLVENAVGVGLFVCSSVAIITTVGIVLSLLFEAIHFFTMVPITDFLFGLHWNPQTAFHGDVAGSFGAVPLFGGTLLITLIAMAVAVPVGLMAAVYMSEYASPRMRAIAKPMLEILAGIPTVVYGFFAALTMAPFLRDFGTALGLEVSSQSALAAGVVMGIMIIPFVSSLSDDVINAVPQALRDGSYGLGATKSETIREIILPAALPGIVGAVMLAISRAIGETMIVAMAAGLSANLTANPLAAVTTVTVQIASTIRGDQEFDSPKTLSVFGLGLVLFVVTLLLNTIALRVVQKYREKYD
ncbi:MAG: phosphate ABC transporter permease subunit PstC [Rhodospirillaceae bacterium]